MDSKPAKDKPKDPVRLTQSRIASLRNKAAESGKADVTYWDDDVTGFGLRIRKGGNISWVYQYQKGISQGKIRIGDAASMPADQARDLAKKERAKLDSGGDPGAQKAEQKLKDKTKLRGVIDDYLKAKENEELRPASLRETRRYLLTTFESLHRIPAHKILKRDIAQIINTIAATRNDRTGKLKKSSAALALAHLNTCLNWAVANDLIDDNPAADITKPKQGSRDRVLNNDELRRIWLACDDGTDPSRIIRLLILTGQRRDEIGGMREEELDRAKGAWTLPEERSKNKRAHSLTLPDMAWQIIGPRDRTATLFGRSAGGYTGWQGFKKNLDERSGVADWVIHDIRRSVATGMAEINIQPHIIEAALNHVSGHKGGIAGIYNRASYQREVRNALAIWADHVRSIVESGEERKIIPMTPNPA